MKKALITGATGGIGLEICKFLGNDHEIYILGRNEEKLKNLSNKFSFIKEYFVCDISESESLTNFFEKISMKNLQIDVLVNNAGVTDDSLFLRMDLKKWNKVINTNLNSNFMISNFFSKQMIKKKWGRIVNITSVVGHTGNAGQSNYTASKAGVIGMTKSIAIELAKRNITVNSISPGFIDTEMTASLSDQQKDFIKNKIPLARIGRPEDVAYCVKFLVSDQANYITGQTIHVNGGLAML
ncbi:MAG: beta-ketoacyl-ACP reductase [Alphaproteobacteria bacterium]